MVPKLCLEYAPVPNLPTFVYVVMHGVTLFLAVDLYYHYLHEKE